MQTKLSAGAKLQRAIELEQPLQLAGTANALCALLAERAGFNALYLSGAGVANASFGLPDLAMTTLNDVVEEVRRIVAVSQLPILVDADTGWGGPFMVGRTVAQLTAAGAAGLHMEDQVASKRCGHRPNKVLVSTEEMVDRVKAAMDGKTDAQFMIMARTDAFAVEGLQGAIDRAAKYVEAGAEMIFAEGLSTLDNFRVFCENIDRPVLANITEFGQTPLFTVKELREVGVRLIIYPVSALRAMSAAAQNVYETLRSDGTQKSLLASMQTREQLYEVLGYYEYENKLDRILTNQDISDT